MEGFSSSLRRIKTVNETKPSKDSSSTGPTNDHVWERANTPTDSTISGFDLNSIDEELRTISIVEALNDTGICILDNFFSKEQSMKITKVTKFLYQNIPGLFTEPLNMTPPSKKFRFDKTCWVKGTENFGECYSEVNRAFTKLIKDILDDYNSTGIDAKPGENRSRSSTKKRVKITHRSKIQISCFPKNTGGYLPHIDNPIDNGRILTLVYYPNEKYDLEECGGLSRFYVNDKTKMMNVEPIQNRLVIYWSDKRVITETLPTFRDVFSLSCWFFGAMK
eukprot:TCONS_00048461-protein